MACLNFRTLIPAGLAVEAWDIGPERVSIKAHAAGLAGHCPSCGRRSDHVHSRYERRLLDLPAHGRVVALQVSVRRFRCANLAVLCTVQR